MRTGSTDHGRLRSGGSPHADHRALTVHTMPAVPQAGVVLLHGGRPDSLDPLPPLSLPALRMRPFGAAIRRTLGEHGLLLASVCYRCRGWNGTRADAAYDAHHALEELAGLAPRIPVVLVGHSMGGRAALLNGGYQSVRGVVALAPWCPPDEPVAHLRERTIVVLHDERDRVTKAEGSWDFVRRARYVGAQAHGIPMPYGGHTMLRGARRWHRLTADLVSAILDRPPARQPFDTAHLK